MALAHSTAIDPPSAAVAPARPAKPDAAPGRPAEKIQSLEMFRALAAGLVVLFHTEAIVSGRTGQAPFGGLFSAGYRGVDLFFVLSGFVIGHVHAGDLGRPARVGRYLYARAARILPALWIVSLAALLTYGTGFGAHGPDKLQPGGILASFLLLPQAGPALVNVSWTLKYEAVFYILFAALILDLRLGVLLLVVWQAAVAVAAAAAVHLPLLPGFYLRGICLEFGLGLLCAWGLHKGRKTPAPWLTLGLGAACFVAGMALDRRTPAAGLLCALGAAAAVLALVSLERAGRIRAPALLVRLGAASYAIYLVHFSVLTLLVAAAGRLGLSVGAGLALGFAACAVAAGETFHLLVDRPLQRRLKRFGRRAGTTAERGRAWSAKAAAE